MNCHQQNYTVIKETILPSGMEIDISEAWKKLISSQFGGGPGKGFGELIQNLLDSYPSTTPWHERKGIITTTNDSISVTDFGEGMNRSRLQLLLTLGGTDKSNDISKIGTFGVGFFSIFNPQLKTREVKVTTRCEGHTVELIFSVGQDGRQPEITTKILEENISFSTRIQVAFNSPHSPQKCLDYAQNCLMYYPCNITINRKKFVNIWENAENSNLTIFKEGYCHGIIDVTANDYSIRVLCKYEHIINLSLPGIVTGGHSMNHDLRDYARKRMPCIPRSSITINCNNLNVTISRDSFMLDNSYLGMIDVLKRVLMGKLREYLENESAQENIILANQYILAESIEGYLNRHQSDTDGIETDSMAVCRILSEAKVYRFNGEKDRYSLKDIREKKSPHLPVYFSPSHFSTRWLGGGYKHDFVVLPPKCTYKSGAPDFYDKIFSTLFKDVINLDTIQDDGIKIQDLLDRGVVLKELLEPNCTIAGERELTENERLIMEELTSLITMDSITEVINKNLQTKIRLIRIIFFEFNQQGAIVATGLFDKHGKFITAPFNEDANEAEEDRTILLGLNRKSNLIQNLISYRGEDRAFFMLPILANELVSSQKWLAPHTKKFHLKRDKLAAEMRAALLDEILLIESNE
jgi:hypothetical protein